MPRPFDEVRGKLERQYLDVDFDPDSGLSKEDLSAELEQHRDGNPDEPRILTRAWLFQLLCTKARLAAGSVAPIALRLFEVEQFLEGKQLNRSLAALAGKQAAKTISPISDIRASQEYRRQIIEVFVRRSIEELIGGKPS